MFVAGRHVQIQGSGEGMLQKVDKAPSDETDLPEDGIALLAAGILCTLTASVADITCLRSTSPSTVFLAEMAG